MSTIDKKIDRNSARDARSSAGAGEGVGTGVVQKSTDVGGAEPGAADVGGAAGGLGPAAGKAIGVGRDAPTVASSKSGAQNAHVGMGVFETCRRQLKRGLVVALLGLTLGQGAGVPILMAHAAVPVGSAQQRVTQALRTQEASKSLSIAMGSAPPPPSPIGDIKVGAVVRFDEDRRQILVPVLGRDTPVGLVQPDGAARDLRMTKGELPARLIERDGFVVEHGDDPGDYYCEHALFVQQKYALESGVLKNAHGETLTGFLHVPSDPHTYKPADASIDASERYARHREVIGAAVFGFFHDAKKMTDEDVRILITGYGTFMGITNNPAGGFVSDPSNIDAAVRHAFGDALVDGKGEPVADRRGASGDETMTLRYRVKDGDKVRAVLITAERLDVADHELSQSDPGSLIGAMREVRPHAMLSLGVHGGSSFMVEFHADDGGLAIDATTGAMRHDGSKSPSQGFLDNYALARAIWQRAHSTSTPRV